MRGQLFLVLLAGFTAGVAIGWTAKPNPPRSPETGPLPLAGLPRATALGASLPSTGSPAGVETGDLAACQRSVAFLAGQLQTYEGVVQAWPDSVAPAFRDAGLRALLTEAWAGKAEVRDLDCEEHPCIVELRLTTGERSCCLQLDEALPPELSAREGKAHIVGGDEGMSAVMAFGAPEQWNDDIAPRTSWRVGEAGVLMRERQSEASVTTAPEAGE